MNKNLYEHTIIARQDVSASQLKSLTEKYTKIIQSHIGTKKMREKIPKTKYFET